MARTDLRPTIYLAIDQLLVIIYAYVVIAVIPNRLLSGAIHLWTLPVCMQVMATGMWLKHLKADKPRRIGWWLGVIGGSALLLSTILMIVRIIVSAAFLSGVYGAFGKAAATTALVGAALVVEIVGLVPLFQVKYLMSRAGRRAFGLPTPS